MSFQDLLNTRDWLLADGATGTTLFAMGLQSGDSPETWNRDHPERIKALHQGFADAGSDIILTNSFGGTRHRLKLHNLQDQVGDLNRRAGEIARNVADNAGRPIIVAGSMGPTGELIEPLGPLSYDGAVDAFAEQAEALREGGVDVLWIETLSAQPELEAAITAASRTGLPVCATMSFDSAGRTMMGLTPGDYAKFAMHYRPGLTAFGANCGIGASELLATISAMDKAGGDGAVIIAKANAGIPSYKDGKIIYSGTEQLMAEYACLAWDAGAKIIGGCCGSTKAHIAAMRKALEAHKPGTAPSPEDIEARIGKITEGAKLLFAGAIGADVQPAPRPSRRRRG